MQEKTTFYIPEDFPEKTPQIVDFLNKLNQYSLKLDTPNFNYREFSQFLEKSQNDPKLALISHSIQGLQNMISLVENGSLGQNFLIGFISEFPSYINDGIRFEQKKSIEVNRNKILHPLRTQIALAILLASKQPIAEISKYNNASSPEEQERLLENIISYSSENSQACFLQFCFEAFKNLNLVTETLYRNHYPEIYEK